VLNARPIIAIEEAVKEVAEILEKIESVTEIEEARIDYEIKFGKKVPNAFKNKLSWLMSKLE
jgi:hypothetical protein